MKKITRGLLIGLMLILASVGIFTACTSKKVTISFETNGGQQIEAIEADKGETVTLPTPVYDAAHAFEGWYDNASCSGTPLTDVVAGEDITYYAKWTDLYLLKLDAKGGTIGQDTYYLAGGTNVYDFVKEITPQTPDADHIFGAWFNGANELTEGTVMTASGLTLTARYKVKYTVHAYLQEKGTENYTLQEQTGYDYAGEYPGFTVEGYEEAEHAGADEWRELSDSAAENEFTVYFNVKQVNILLFANYPDGSSDQETLTAAYGDEIDLPTERFKAAGYLLRGWSTSAGGELLVESSYLYDHLYNKEGFEAPAPYTVKETAGLYAVWEQAYFDLFGGDDLVYHFSEEDENVFIERNGVFFRAEYSRTQKGSFFNLDPEDRQASKTGKFSAGRTFLYTDTSRRGTYYLYENFAVNQAVTLVFDDGDGVQYIRSYPDELNRPSDISDGTFTFRQEETAAGTYMIYALTFTTGELQGQTFNVQRGSLGAQRVFQVRNDEEAALGTLYRFADETRYYPSSWQLILSGFGIATLNDNGSGTTYYYKFDHESETITLEDSSHNPVYTLYFATMGDRYGYYLYEEDYDNTFVAADGSTFAANGLYEADYMPHGGGVVHGTYLPELTSRLGGRVVDFTAGEQTYRLLLTITPAEEEDGEPTYAFEVLSETYSEMLFMGDDGTVYYGPLLVTDKDGAGSASLYRYVQTGRLYKKFAEGTYERNEQSGYYVFTLTNYCEEEPDAASGYPFDASKLTSFVYGLASSSSAGTVYYMYCYTLEGQDPTHYDVAYTSQDGKETLTLAAGFAFYKVEEGLLVGQYSRQGDLLTLTVSTSSGSASLNFEMNDEAHTFRRFTANYGTFYAYANGSVDRTHYLVFDGMGGAVYHDTAAEKTVEGTYESREEDVTRFGSHFFRFVANEGTEDNFSFGMVTSGSSTYFTFYNEKFDKVFNNNETGEMLELDGYITARITTAGSQALNGSYVFNEELGILQVSVQQGTASARFYIDLDFEAGTFTIRGPEYTDLCLYLDNQQMQTIYFSLDGNGTLVAYDLESREQISEKGAYDLNDDGTVIIKYTPKGGEEVVLYGELVVMQVSGSSFLALIVRHEEAAGTYVNAQDFTVLNLDAYGTAVRYNSNGVAENGQYQLITETLFFFQGSSDAIIYRYDTSRGTVTPIAYQNEYGYYTSDLDAITFSKSGYMNFEGERCYYTLEENESRVLYPVIYRSARDTDAEDTVNKYGYVEDKTFGTFDIEKDYNEKHYFRSMGIDITFSRATDNASKYPILTGSKTTDEGEREEIYSALKDLKFRPNGDGNFSVSGTVQLEGLNDGTCTVVREKSGDGPATFSLRLATAVGYYRLDFTIEYHGDLAERGANTYTVSAMTNVVEMPAYNWLSANFLYYLLSQGTVSLPNTFGTMQVTRACGEDGKISEDAYMTLTLGASLQGQLIDYDGTPISIDHTSCTLVTGQDYQYEVEYKPDDGYTYMLRLRQDYFQYMSAYGFSVYSFTRVQEFDVTLGDGKTGKMEVERLIYSDAMNATPGLISDVRIYEGEEKTLIEPETAYLLNEEGTALDLIVRTRDEDNVITKTTYYTVTLQEVTLSGGVEDPKAGYVQPYQSGTVEVREMTTKYSADGKSFADIDSENNIRRFYIGSTSYFVESCSYDAGTKTYTVTVANTAGDRTFTITEGDDGKLTFAETTATA